MRFSPAEWVMVGLVAAVAAVVATVTVFLSGAAGFLTGVMGAFALSCLAGAIGLGGGDE